MSEELMRSLAGTAIERLTEALAEPDPMKRVVLLAWGYEDAGAAHFQAASLARAEYRRSRAQ